MARKLLRHTVTIVTPVLLTGMLFFGLGLWRRSGDTKWCRQASSAAVAGGQGLTPVLLEDARTACIVQRERQRVIFGAVWRKGGQETARCGFELARLQLFSDRDPGLGDAILQRYGIDGSGFERSSREDQDRFVKACLSNRRPAGVR